MWFKRKVTILSVDGGGIRGYIPALILREVEKRLARRGVDKSLGRCFDLIAGTSTGAMIALGLAAPKELPNTAYSRKEAAFTSADLAALYEEHGLEIFPRRIFRQFQTMRHAFTEKYSDGRFYDLLKHYFGERTINDALTNVLITSFDIDSYQPVIIKKTPSRRRTSKPANFYMSDATRASAAAPTYFEPIRISSVDNAEHYSLIDGAVFANNPAMCAFVEAQKIFPRAKSFVILSLGTGSSSPRYTYEQMKSWGVLEWIQPSKGVPIANIMNYGQSQCTNYQLEHLPRVEYLRINPGIEGCNPAIDDAAEETMACLKRSAERGIEQYEATIDRIVSILG